MQDLLATGTVRAGHASAELIERGSPVHLGDLLRLCPKRPGPEAGAPTHSAAAKFAGFLNQTAEEIPIHLLETEQERFVEYLRARRHTGETVRSYRYALNLLLRAARENGWEPPVQVLPPD